LGETFVLAGRWLADTDRPANRLRLVDLDDPSKTLDLIAYNPHSACIGPRSRKVFWNSDNSVMVRSLDATYSDTVLETFSRNPWHLHLSPDESLLAIGLSDRELYLWDWRAKKRVGPVMMHEGQIHAMAFSPGGRTVMTVDDSATLRFWNITTGQQVSQTNLGISPDSVINRAKITPDGNFVMVLHDGHTITTVRIR
jgi:WD40 repeat protein